jgi:hypothetical protein
MSYIYVNTRVFECNVVSKFQSNRWITFRVLRSGTNGHLHFYIYIYQHQIYFSPLVGFPFAGSSPTKIFNVTWSNSVTPKIKSHYVLPKLRKIQPICSTNIKENSINQNVYYPRSSHLYRRINIMFYFSFIAHQSMVGLVLIIISASRSHSDTSHPAGLLWTSDQSDAETSTLQHSKLTRDTQLCPWLDSNPHSQQPCGRRSTT